MMPGNSFNRNMPYGSNGRSPMNEPQLRNPNQTDPNLKRNFGSITDVGYVRDHNEDNLLVRPPLFVVCDGMGGHNAGEVASAIAVDVISKRAPSYLDAKSLERAIEEANLSILQAVHAGDGREGMGTTCTAAILDGERLIIGQVGDSRAYLLHNGRLQQITRDHSLVADLVDKGEITVEEARVHPWRSYITRALGLDPTVKPDMYELNVSLGDRLMLCSDGLYSMVDDPIIASILSTTPDPDLACEKLCQAALDAGGTDNVSIIVADCYKLSDNKIRKLTKKAKRSAILIVSILIAIILACLIGFNVMVSNSAFLGDHDGNVAIYKGIPGDIGGITFSELEEVTEVPLDDLQPGTARRIRSGDIRCTSIQDARDLVNDYRQEIKDRFPSDQVSSDDPSGASTDTAPGTQSNATPEASSDPTGEPDVTP